MSSFRDLYPLRDLVGLEELILDDNKITSHTKFPSLPKLQNLWVNRNGITSLTFFIDKIVASYPDLIMLSMLNNEACPNYFNSGTPAEYQDYRCGLKSRRIPFRFHLLFHTYTDLFLCSAQILCDTSINKASITGFNTRFATRTCRSAQEVCGDGKHVRG